MGKNEPGKAKSGLSRIIFSRTGFILLLILIQLGIFVMTTNLLQSYALFINGILRVLGVIVLIYIINAEGNPAFKMTWMLCVMAFPAVGTLFYIYVKTQVGVRWMGKRLATLKIETDPYMMQDMDVVDALRASKPANANLAYYLAHHMGFPTYRNTEVTYFPLGEDKFEALVPELKKARKYIFMEYFIVEKGYMWDTILKILVQKAREGVEVRHLQSSLRVSPGAGAKRDPVQDDEPHQAFPVYGAEQQGSPQDLRDRRESGLHRRHQSGR